MVAGGRRGCGDVVGDAVACTVVLLSSFSCMYCLLSVVSNETAMLGMRVQGLPWVLIHTYRTTSVGWENFLAM